MTATQFSMTGDRERAVNFTFVCKQDLIIYVTKRLAGFGWTSSYFLAKPLQTEVWVLLGIIVLFTMLTLPLVRLCFPKYKRLVKTFTLWNILSIIMGISI